MTHLLTNFEIQQYYQSELRFYDVYSRENLRNEVKDGTYVINHDEYANIGTHWIALYVNDNSETYFDSFGVEHIPKESKKFIGNRNITKICKIQAQKPWCTGYHEKLNLTLREFKTCSRRACWIFTMVRISDNGHD